MEVSIVELYKITGTDPKINTLMPVTSNLDGDYPGEAVVNMGLMMFLNAYQEAERKQALHRIHEDSISPDSLRWAKVLESYVFMDKDKEEDREYAEYGLLVSQEKGYLKVEFWDGYRYFKPTEKCMNLKLYKYREIE